jgi:flagellar motility protein MotE (MotC chaperone)
MNVWLILYRKMKILPLTMLIVFIAMFVRIESAQKNAKIGLLISSPLVQAEEKRSEAKPDAKAEGDHAKDDKEHADATTEGEKHDAPAVEAKPIDPLDVTGQPMRASSELAILEELADRRRDLDKREAAVSEKEALLSVSEKQFDDKIKELSKLRDEIKTLVDSAQSKEDGETKRLVVIYEKMKPKEAAAIFNTMDMNILLPIVSGMKETKLSPILATMLPERAREVTDRMSKKAVILPQDTPVRAAAEAAARESLPALPPPPAE